MPVLDGYEADGTGTIVRDPAPSQSTAGRDVLEAGGMRRGCGGRRPGALAGGEPAVTIGGVTCHEARHHGRVHASLRARPRRPTPGFVGGRAVRGSPAAMRRSTRARATSPPGTTSNAALAGRMRSDERFRVLRPSGRSRDKPEARSCVTWFLDATLRRAPSHRGRGRRSRSASVVLDASRCATKRSSGTAGFVGASRRSRSATSKTCAEMTRRWQRSPRLSTSRWGA